MPQVGRGDKEFSFALDKLTNNISQNRGTSDLFLMGDWNLSEKHTIKRQEILHKKTRDWNTVITKPKEFTNLNFCGSKSTLDYAVHSDNIQCELKVLPHKDCPLNSSTHTPVIAKIVYKKEALTQKHSECSSNSMSHLFYKHQRIDEDNFDFELYQKKTRIYALAALRLTEGMNACDRLSVLSHMLTSAADRCIPVIETNTTKSDLELEHAKQMQSEIRRFSRTIHKKKKIT